MKSNFFKYLFIIFVIGIMIFAIFKIKSDEKETENNQVQSEEQQKNTEIIVGVASLIV